MHYKKKRTFSLFFLKKKSEIWNAFTYFENEKWNENALKSRSRMKSEMKRPWNRDREWKMKWKCLEIEIEKWNVQKILENSRETRLSQVTGSQWDGLFTTALLAWYLPQLQARSNLKDDCHRVLVPKSQVENIFQCFGLIFILMDRLGALLSTLGANLVKDILYKAVGLDGLRVGWGI